MRAVAMVIVLAAGAVCGLEAQAVASPASRQLPRSPARGIRTEPPPPPEPGQPTPPAQPAEPTRSDQPPSRTVYVGGAAPYYYYTYGVGYGGAYVESEGTYAQQAPPPSQIDVRGPQPGPAMTFMPGFWSWTGSSYNWNEGRWVPIPAGFTRWVAGRWVQNQFGYYRIRGYWEP